MSVSIPVRLYVDKVCVRGISVTHPVRIRVSLGSESWTSSTAEVDGGAAEWSPARVFGKKSDVSRIETLNIDVLEQQGGGHVKVRGSSLHTLAPLLDPATSTGALAGWAPLYRKDDCVGEVYVQLRLSGTLAPRMEEPPPEAPHTDADALCVTVHVLTLMAPAPDGRRAIPSVTVIYGQEVRTSIKTGESPVGYEEAFLFPVDAAATGHDLCFRVEHNGPHGRTDRIASLEFPSHDIDLLRGTNMRRPFPLVDSTGVPVGSLDLSLSWHDFGWGGKGGPGTAPTNLLGDYLAKKLTPAEVKALTAAAAAAAAPPPATAAAAAADAQVAPPPGSPRKRQGKGSASSSASSSASAGDGTVTASLADSDAQEGGNVEDDSLPKGGAARTALEDGLAGSGGFLDDEPHALKPGAYTVAVHIIEARGLKSEDAEGTSDPVVHVEVAGKKQHTRIIRKRNNPVWDETLLFSLPDMSSAELEAVTVTVRVLDADFLSAADLIGSYTFDLATVYAQPHHEYYRTWVGLLDTLKESDRGVQGLLQLSVTALGPGDAPHVHPPGEAAAGGDDPETGALVLLPPSAERTLKFLVLTLYGADGLPAMDGRVGSGFTSAFASGGIDAFCRVQFGNAKAGNTRWITAKGTGNLRVDWCEEVWVPALLPVMSDRVDVSLWDYDRVSANERVGSLALSFKDILQQPLAPAYYPVYGPPDRYTDSAAALRMAQFPSLASTYRGRVLLSARIENDSAAVQEKTHTRPATRPPDAFLPELEQYSLRALVVLGDALPLTGSQEVSVALAVGGFVVHTQKVRCVAGTGQARWETMLELDGITLPARWRASGDAGGGGGGGAGAGEGGDAQWQEEKKAHYDRFGGYSSPLPDTLVYLFRGEWGASSYQQLCYARLHTRDLLRRGAGGSAPYWQPLVEDTAVNAVSDRQHSGAVLMKVALVPEGTRVEDWSGELAEAKQLTPYELRVHVYSGADLPAADADGGLDAYLRITLNGQTRRTSTKTKTNFPSWYESIIIQTLLPPARWAPFVHVSLWDHDDITADDFVAEMRFPLASPLCLAHDAARMPPSLPRPSWYPLTRLESGAVNVLKSERPNHGKLLLTFQLIRKDTPNQIVPRVPASILPACEDWLVEVIVVGLRGLEAFRGMPLWSPYVQLHLGDLSKSTNLKATNPSRKPSGSNPNYCQRLLLPVKVPRDPLFAPVVNLIVRDRFMRGLSNPVVGTAFIPLTDKLPWSPSFRAARGVVASSSSHPDAEEEAVVAPSPVSTGTDSSDSDSGGEEEGEGQDDVPLLRKRGGKKSSGSRQRRTARQASDSVATDATGATGATGGTEDDDDKEEEDEEEGERRRAASASSSASSATSGNDSAAEVEETAGGAGGGGDSTAITIGIGIAAPGGPKAEGSDYAPNIDSYGIDHSRYLLKEDGSVGVQDEGEIAYMRGRRVYARGLEDVFQSSPFQTFPIMRGQRVGRGVNPLTGRPLADTTHVAGKMKGLIRLIKSADDAPPLDLVALRTPQLLVVRVYVLCGYNLQPKDANGSADPYLKVKLGNTVLSGRDEYKKGTLNPEFYKCFEVKTSLPGPSQLSVEVYDADTFSADDFIGVTKIDLEDRWFDPAWKAIGKELESGTRYRPKPLETRSLWSPHSTVSQGAITLWVDILTPAQAHKYPPVKISPPPPAAYEVRLVIWGSRNVPAGDSVSGGGDLFCRAQLHGDREAETDTHWRCRTGAASFNYRMKFKASLPTRFPYLTIQLYDRDVLKYSDHLGEVVLNLGPHFARSRRIADAVHVFATDPSVLGEQAFEESLALRQRKRTGAGGGLGAAAGGGGAAGVDASRRGSALGGGGGSVDEVAIAMPSSPPRAATGGAGGTGLKLGASRRHAGGSAAAAIAGADRDRDKDKYKDREGAGGEGEGEGEKGGLLGGSALANAALAAAKQKGGAAGTLASLMVKSGGASGSSSGGGDTAARDTLSQLRKATGTAKVEVRPEHAQWVPLYRYEHGDAKEKVVDWAKSTGAATSAASAGGGGAGGAGMRMVPAGELLLSCEVMPAEVAARYAAGTGRAEPNVYPPLPPPVGRLQMTLNPLALLGEAMGKRACIAIVVATVGSAAGAVAVFGIPFLNSLTAMIGGLPEAAKTAIWVLVGVLGIGLPLLCCGHALCRKRPPPPEPLVISGFAADFSAHPDADVEYAESDDDEAEGEDGDSEM